ncbi:hypothetical protein QJS24_gp14 [Serratia phage vB_SmaS_Rovert]|uniref:Uncharacterized protein n=1 Tax=Serratia phage vB_SmaS_Rovert TaxID=2777363 RepID=A0A7T3N9Q9_9CAUD|nr:hypothetical protein QJS24_gp14 [Serratia phage vB_SmaS_Rovert]QPX74982.1 hypothetical protein [Serratia phage vB_SmaS_Rovert]
MAFLIGDKMNKISLKLFHAIFDAENDVATMRAMGCYGMANAANKLKVKKLRRYFKEFSGKSVNSLHLQAYGRMNRNKAG